MIGSCLFTDTSFAEAEWQCEKRCISVETKSFWTALPARRVCSPWQENERGMPVLRVAKLESCHYSNTGLYCDGVINRMLKRIVW